MKCILSVRGDTRHVVRVPDDLAHKLVKQGGWHYVAKHVWKQAGRPSAQPARRAA